MKTFECGIFTMKLSVFEGFAAIIVGIVFIFWAIFFRNMFHATLPLSIIAFGVLNIFNALNLKNDIGKKYSRGFIILGSIVIIFGLSILLDIVPFINGFEFYIMSGIFIISGGIGVFSNINRIYDLSSVVILAMGLASILINVCSLNSSVYLPIMVGITLIGEGFALLFSY